MSSDGYLPAVISVVDAADPRSLATILPPELASVVTELPQELLAQDEVTLNTLVSPTDQQKRIKIQFWDEYEEAVNQKRPMSLSNIIFGVATREYLLEFVKVKRNVAWLISPRPSYKVRVAELIEKGLDRIEKIFSIDVTKEDKNAVSLFNLQLSALRMLDMRKHGGYTQRVEQKTLQVNKTIGSDTPGRDPQETPFTGEGSVEELERQVAELEQKIKAGKNQNGALLNVPQADVIDLTPRMEDGREAYTSSEAE